MLQNPCKTLGFKKNMVYKIPPGGEVNHIQPVAYTSIFCLMIYLRHFAIFVFQIIGCLLNGVDFLGNLGMTGYVN